MAGKRLFFVLGLIGIVCVAAGGVVYAITREFSVIPLSLVWGGLLWLAPENGICQVETPSPLTRFDAADGLTGTVEDMLRHQGLLYVSTSDGVFYLDAGITQYLGRSDARQLQQMRRRD